MTTIALKDQKLIGTGCGFGGSIRFTITTIATTVYNAILSNRLAVTVPNITVPAVIQAGLPESSVPAFLSALSGGSTDALSAVPSITPAIIQAGLQAYKQANIQAYHTLFLSTLAFAGLGILILPFFADVDQAMTDDITTVLVRVHEESDPGEKCAA